jgi:hypothetical protein
VILAAAKPFKHPILGIGIKPFKSSTGCVRTTPGCSTGVRPKRKKAD